MNIDETCLRIAKLLGDHDNPDWSKSFRALAANFKQAPEAAKIAIRSLYGGVGSFYDVVLLDTTGRWRQAENDELDLLRETLYQACQTSAD